MPQITLATETKEEVIHTPPQASSITFPYTPQEPHTSGECHDSSFQQLSSPAARLDLCAIESLLVDPPQPSPSVSVHELRRVPGLHLPLCWTWAWHGRVTSVC